MGARRKIFVRNLESKYIGNCQLAVGIVVHVFQSFPSVQSSSHVETT